MKRSRSSPLFVRYRPSHLCKVSTSHVSCTCVTDIVAQRNVTSVREHGRPLWRLYPRPQWPRRHGPCRSPCLHGLQSGHNRRRRSHATQRHAEKPYLRSFPCKKGAKSPSIHPRIPARPTLLPAARTKNGSLLLLQNASIKTRTGMSTWPFVQIVAQAHKTTQLRSPGPRATRGRCTRTVSTIYHCLITCRLTRTLLRRYNTTLRAIIPLPDPNAPPDSATHLNAYPEFAAGSTVMALYPDTSCFYRAEVIATPRDLNAASRVSTVVIPCPYDVA